MYKYKKTTQKLTKAFEPLLTPSLLQLCRSRFRLIISEQKFIFIIESRTFFVNLNVALISAHQIS